MKFHTRPLSCTRRPSIFRSPEGQAGHAVRRSLLSILALLALLSFGLDRPPSTAQASLPALSPAKVGPVMLVAQPAEGDPDREPGGEDGASDEVPAASPPPTDATAPDQDVESGRDNRAAVPPAARRPAFRSVPAYRQADTVVIITIEGEIDGITKRSIDRRLQEAARFGADAVVFEIDTFGGQGAAALEICQLIKDSPVPLTVAWINPKAYSAGTFIALACHEIVVTPRAELGDAAPVLPGLIPIPPAERAKIESPFLNEVVESARMGAKYDERLVMSFVAVDMELWFIENVETGERRFVDRKEYAFLFGEEPPDTARVQASGGLPGVDPATGNPLPETPFEPVPAPPGGEGGGDGVAGPDDPGEVPPAPGAPGGGGRIHKYFGGPIVPSPLEQQGLSAEERDRLIDQQQLLPSQRTTFSETDRGQWRLLEPVIDKSTLLTLTAPEALRYGLAQATILNDQELMDYFGTTNPPIRLNQLWSESLVQMLTSMPVRILLLALFLIGLLWELTTPGMGAPGFMAMIALLILLGAPALAGLAGWWEVLFVILGIGLLAIEMFVLPGFGFIGAAGLLMLGVGFIGSFISPDPGGGMFATSEQTQRELMQGLASLILALFGCGVAMWFGARNIEKLPMFSRLVLTSSSADDDDIPPRSPAALRGGGDPLIAAMAPGETVGRPAVGDLGTTLTTLRPVGRAEINGNVYDVESGRGTIEPNTAIRVFRVDRFRIVVEEEVGGPTAEGRAGRSGAAEGGGVV